MTPRKRRQKTTPGLLFVESVKTTQKTMPSNEADNDARAFNRGVGKNAVSNDVKNDAKDYVPKTELKVHLLLAVINLRNSLTYECVIYLFSLETTYLWPPTVWGMKTTKVTDHPSDFSCRPKTTPRNDIKNDAKLFT